MIKTLKEAQDYLYSFLPKEILYKFPGDFGLKRTKYLLSLLDSPQEKIKVIHIAGTSGKGSTAFYLSRLLQNHSKKVGLHISPHLVDIRERFQINNTLISEKLLCSYLNQLRPALNKMKDSQFGVPTYFEVTVALAYYIFWKEQVDYAVIETGLGGLYDGTNVVDSPSKLAIITRIGHDHTEILGKTLDKIAFQKAGIIQQYNTVISLYQHPNALKVIKAASRKMNGKLFFVKRRENFKNYTIKNNQTFFTFAFSECKIKHIELDTAALYQIENASLALTALYFLHQRDSFQINEMIVRETLKTTQFKGRMEMFTFKNRTIILDGAHNPQKMSAFITSLQKQFPNKTFDFLFAVKRGKDYKDMLSQIIPLAHSITITQFSSKNQGFILASENPEIVKQYLLKKVKSVTIHSDPIEAYINLINSATHDVVVTGSLYLLSELYSHLDLKK